MVATRTIEDIEINNRDILKVTGEINPSESEGPYTFKIILTKIFRKPLDEMNGKKLLLLRCIKNGKKTMVKNYRQISVTSISCRLMEKIVRNAIVKHLEEDFHHLNMDSRKVNRVLPNFLNS